LLQYTETPKKGKAQEIIKHYFEIGDILGRRLPRDVLTLHMIIIAITPEKSI
jgi:hypothetical protein